jgi:glyoxylase-like metal-dependent hydrolase (beta-lactamase superfamily II)
MPFLLPAAFLRFGGPIFCAVLVTSLATTAAAQDARAVIADASRAMGTEKLSSITYSGSAATVFFGQTEHMIGPWPMDPIRRYSRTLDFTQPRSLATGTVWQMAILVGGAPQPDPYVRNIVPGNANWAQQLDIWTTPWGFLRGAAANQATVRSQTIGGQPFSVVSWKTPQKAPSGLPYTVVGYIDDRKMVTRVETWVDHFLVGDLHVEAEYSGYRDFGGVKVPAHMVQKQMGWPVFETDITGATANPANLADLFRRPPPPERTGPVPTSEQPRSTRPADKIADGVYRIFGGLGGDHIALAVEMKDHIVLLEGGSEDEARGLAAIAETRRVFPNKPIKYVAAMHAHFDHAGGLPPFVAEGITVITHENNVPFLELALNAPRTLLDDALARKPRKPVFEAVRDRAVLQDETRTIEFHYIRGYRHSDSTLVAYLPKEKILFQGDFSLPLGGRGFAPTRPGQTNEWIFTLVDNFDRLNLWDFTLFVPVHPPEPDAVWTKQDVLRAVGRAD